MRVRTNLPLLLQNRGMSQNDLSEATGIPRVYIVYFASGRMIPSGEQLEKICKALGVTPDLIYPDPTLRDCLADDPPPREKSRAASALYEARKEARREVRKNR